MTTASKGSIHDLRKRKYEVKDVKPDLQTRVKRAEEFLADIGARWIDDSGDVQFDIKKMEEPKNAAVYRQFCSDLYKLELKQMLN